jgi:hypothetical protein
MARGRKPPRRERITTQVFEGLLFVTHVSFSHEPPPDRKLPALLAVFARVSIGFETFVSGLSCPFTYFGFEAFASGTGFWTAGAFWGAAAFGAGLLAPGALMEAGGREALAHFLAIFFPRFTILR